MRHQARDMIVPPRIVLLWVCQLDRIKYFSGRAQYYSSKTPLWLMHFNVWQNISILNNISLINLYTQFTTIHHGTVQFTIEGIHTKESHYLPSPCFCLLWLLESHLFGFRKAFEQLPCNFISMIELLTCQIYS
jgi:hypothetical protein